MVSLVSTHARTHKKSSGDTGFFRVKNAFTFDRVTGPGELLVKNADICTLALVS